MNTSRLNRIADTGRRCVYPLLIASLLLLNACAFATPTQRIFETARRLEFQPLTLTGGQFRLAAFFKPGTIDSTTLHVYLEGDGTPWITRWQIAADPTPRQPVMLELMALDPHPALYLGRPCYYGHAEDIGCSPALWTMRRYGPEVVDSLAAALRGWWDNHDFHGLALFGHSGGGTLALLLAPKFPETHAIATLAANLDIAVWTAHHQYAPLEGSFNPAQNPPTGVPEYHYLGAEDNVVPPALFAPIAATRSQVKPVIVPGVGHSCCWRSIWATILKRLDANPHP